MCADSQNQVAQEVLMEAKENEFQEHEAKEKEFQEHEEELRKAIEGIDWYKHLDDYNDDDDDDDADDDEDDDAGDEDGIGDEYVRWKMWQRAESSAQMKIAAIRRDLARHHRVAPEPPFAPLFPEGNLDKLTELLGKPQNLGDKGVLRLVKSMVLTGEYDWYNLLETFVTPARKDFKDYIPGTPFAFSGRQGVKKYRASLVLEVLEVLLERLTSSLGLERFVSNKDLQVDVQLVAGMLPGIPDNRPLELQRYGHPPEDEKERSERSKEVALRTGIATLIHGMTIASHFCGGLLENLLKCIRRYELKHPDIPLFQELKDPLDVNKVSANGQTLGHLLLVDNRCPYNYAAFLAWLDHPHVTLESLEKKDIKGRSLLHYIAMSSNPATKGGEMLERYFQAVRERERLSEAATRINALTRGFLARRVVSVRM